MDMMKMGSYLAELRKEHGMTQAELGEKLGVTNKTVSRWETGSYMPPVDILELLSQMYGLTINELLSGRPLSRDEYVEMAETNIRDTLLASTFDRKEKMTYFKSKWRKDHTSTIVTCSISWIVLLIALRLQGCELYLCGTIGGLLAVLYFAILNNRMMTYVEDQIFGGKWNSSSSDSRS